MWRYFDISVSDFGIILVVCGIVCVILGLTRRAHAPMLSLIFGLIMLLCGSLMWLIPRLDIPEVFSYIVDGGLYERASLDKRFWLGFMDSPFQKRFTEGDRYDIYLNPQNPSRIALSRRPHFGLFSYCGVLLLVGSMLY